MSLVSSYADVVGEAAMELGQQSQAIIETFETLRSLKKFIPYSKPLAPPAPPVRCMWHVKGHVVYAVDMSLNFLLIAKKSKRSAPLSSSSSRPPFTSKFAMTPSEDKVGSIWECEISEGLSL